MATKKPTARIPQELKMANAIPVSTPKVEPEVTVVPPEVAAAKPVVVRKGTESIGAHGETIRDN